ncbi:unnamed protein product [Ostreobium quekettii]|uniref:Tetrapyrrole methylase domain-containing protein n=1 Tax=Ostreobium quekettii TaxID=121088 RepID=A0A8S1J8Q2_9CHLO|nr:unnamed protein product [Ostreobium quekettii]
MIPGVSSALAGPVLAGMPLTDTHLSKSYAVVSGHDLSQYDWAALKAVDTLVVMMGSRSLPQLIDVLREGGWPPDAKIAIIHSASRDGQDELYGDLQDIVGKTNGRDLSPSIIVVGGAVALTHPGHQSFRPQLQQMMPN